MAHINFWEISKSGIGHDPEKFSEHSMRAGLVTSASRIGISGFAIRRQTGHASDLKMCGMCDICGTDCCSPKTLLGVYFNGFTFCAWPARRTTPLQLQRRTRHRALFGDTFRRMGSSIISPAICPTSQTARISRFFLQLMAFTARIGRMKRNCGLSRKVVR